MKEVLSIIAGVLAIVAIIPYVKDIVRGTTKPNVVSWFTWTVLLIIATSAAFAAHEPRSAYLTLGDLIGTGTIVLLGLKYGVAKFTKLDVFCQLGAVVGLILWFVFNSPVTAILAAIIIDFIAAIPTLHHSWLHPEEETPSTFFVLVFASFLTLISLERFNIASLSFAIYLLAINAAIALTIVYRKVAMKTNQKKMV